MVVAMDRFEVEGSSPAMLLLLPLGEEEEGLYNLGEQDEAFLKLEVESDTCMMCCELMNDDLLDGQMMVMEEGVVVEFLVDDQHDQHWEDYHTMTHEEDVAPLGVDGVAAGVHVAVLYQDFDSHSFEDNEMIEHSSLSILLVLLLDDSLDVEQKAY